LESYTFDVCIQLCMFICMAALLICFVATFFARVCPLHFVIDSRSKLPSIEKFQSSESLNRYYTRHGVFMSKQSSISGCVEIARVAGPRRRTPSAVSPKSTNVRAYGAKMYVIDLEGKSGQLILLLSCCVPFGYDGRRIWSFSLLSIIPYDLRVPAKSSTATARDFQRTK
jgi:hypothetical protein